MIDDIAVRRLETLSDTVFGVAITFMTYRLPAPDRSGPPPDWSSLTSAFGPHLMALVLSFCVALIFWLSHHRRLVASPRPGSAAMLLNFGFLLLIVLLPVTSDLFGTFGSDGDAVGLYAGHLALISAINLILWVSAATRKPPPGTAWPRWRAIVGPGFVAAIFVSAAILARWHPGGAEYLMLFAFLGPLVSQAVRREQAERRLGPWTPRSGLRRPAPRTPGRRAGLGNPARCMN